MCLTPINMQISDKSRGWEEIWSLSMCVHVCVRVLHSHYIGLTQFMCVKKKKKTDAEKCVITHI